MTSDVVSPRKSDKPARELSPEQAAAAAMVAEAKARGLALTGPDGLLKLFTKNVLETALAEEMTEHVGHEKNQAESDRESTNVRNGARSKTVVSDAAGEVEINVPRDRESTFEPQIVKKKATAAYRCGRDRAVAVCEGHDYGRYFGAFRRYLRCLGVEGDDLADHRQGRR
jgi:putative transposase